MMKTITVAELIDLLQNADPDAQVIFTTDYGDRSHTAQALPIRGKSEEVRIEKNAYSNSGFAIASEEDEDEEYKTYLVIR